MNNIPPLLSSLQRNMEAMQASRARLRLATEAIARRQFDNTAPSDINTPLTADTAARLEGRANVMDATLDLLQQRVMTDISGAMQRLDALARFNTSSANTPAAPDPASPPAGATGAQADVIDVEARDVTQTAGTA